jgi:hypothetical protein
VPRKTASPCGNLPTRGRGEWLSDRMSTCRKEETIALQAQRTMRNNKSPRGVHASTSSIDRLRKDSGLDAAVAQLRAQHYTSNPRRKALTDTGP